ncbi:hypothetical protein [Thiohalocapsa sp. ML1]|uniref:hypothetical protein n=1 Tax=Thiohalocapsa sp. ML1 TaxID=1431688 RepID=UPI0007320628|nr:hypothetical protein [Thiohalocapsa sp. ML1]
MNLGPTLLLLAAGGVAMVGFGMIAWDSLDYWHWGDEDEKLVAAWMIASGGRLYDDIFAHHGPLNYALAHVVHALSGSIELAPYRAAQWTTVLLAALALAASPLLEGALRRVAAASLFCLLVALLAPLWYGHTLLYHSLGGVAISIALCLLLLPLSFGLCPSRLQAAAGGAALSAAVFAAYPFAVPVVLLTLAALLLVRSRGLAWRDVRGALLAAAAGFGAGTLLMLLWLLRYGDVVGYAVYHLWFNQVVYAGFIDFEPGVALRQLEKVFQSPLGWVLQAILLFWLALLLEARAAMQGAHRLRWLWLPGGAVIFLVGILFLNPRGEVVFKNAALWIVGLALISLLICRAPAAPGVAGAVRVLRVLAVLVAIAAPVYLAGIKGWSDVDGRYVTRAYAEKKHAGSAKRVRLAQALVPAGEPILAVVFSPRWYLLIERLPSSGAYYYLPWQAAYNRAPVLGYRLDPCADLERAPPKLIVWDRWPVWDRYDVADYAPCLVELMQRDYVAVSGTQFLLRKPVGDADRALVAGFGASLEPVTAGD